ncbi:MAG: hypothetical protein V3V28_08670 [Polaribacter sp.]|uniref:hypothetical protein n=1 Tax=Polaribacter sp. TaxID=1920175 RepID=UPI002F353A2B
MAGLNQEVWTDVAVLQYRETEDAQFLNEITDESRHVNDTKSGKNQTIHLVDIGIDPEVLINNTTYPIPAAAQTDADIPINLDKYQTYVTNVTDDELDYIAYDKVKIVQQKHVKAIMARKHAKAAHALTPSTNTANTPILVTTGETVDGRKRLIRRDVLTLKSAWDKLKIPQSQRILVLCSDHYNDLLWEAIEMKKSADHLSSNEFGLLKQRIEGFKTYWYVDCPHITVATKVKKSFGSIPGAGDKEASFAFVSDDMFKAMGATVFYEDKPTPRTQQWEFNMKHFFIVLPRKARGIAAIVSDIA